MAAASRSAALDAPRTRRRARGSTTSSARGVEETVTLTITDPDGEQVRSFTSEPPPPLPIPEALIELMKAFGIDFGTKPLTTNVGHNRYLWNLAYDAQRLPPGRGDLRLHAGGNRSSRGATS